MLPVTADASYKFQTRLLPIQEFDSQAFETLSGLIILKTDV